MVEDGITQKSKHQNNIAEQNYCMSTSKSEVLFERAIPAIQLIIPVFVYYYRTEVRSLYSLGKVELRQIIRG